MIYNNCKNKLHAFQHDSILKYHSNQDKLAFERNYLLSEYIPDISFYLPNNLTTFELSAGINFLYVL